MLKALKSSSSKSDSERDVSGCPHQEGLLKKKNSHGVWKDRYCLLSNAYFLTYKPKGKKPSSELKESINLKDVETVSVDRDTLEIAMKNGDKLFFQGQNLKQWCNALDIRMGWALNQYQQSLGKQDSKGVHISGWLMKKSHNKYQGFQERFVKVEGHHLRYYKREHDSEDQGAADLSTVSSIRPYDDNPDCRVFEVQDADRTFIFQASTAKEMAHWIRTLEEVRAAVLLSAQEKQKEKLKQETPACIRVYDEKGEEYFKDAVSKDLAECYPETVTTVKQHVEGCAEAAAYLQDIIPDVQKCAQRPARYDVLAVVMTLVNEIITQRLLTFLPAPPGTAGGSEEESGECSELLENATLGDLHALIDWLTKYQQVLRGIRCPVATGKESSAPPSASPAPPSSGGARLSTTHTTPKACPVLDVLPVICRLYVYGGSAGSRGGAAAHLVDHCVKVWDNVVRHPEEMIQRNNDGSFYTHAPIDMWEAINQHIQLATATRSPILHVMIADKVVTSLNSVFNTIIQYVQTLDTSQKPELREIELEYISALANDTALHIEEVIDLIENFTIPEIRERIDEIFDPLTTNVVNCGQACLKRLAKCVMSDVQGQLDAVFTEEWLDGNHVQVAIATISDYMRDFEDYLVSFWADKFIHTILEEVILSYTRSVIFKKKATTSTAAMLLGFGGGSSSSGGGSSSVSAPAGSPGAPGGPLASPKSGMLSSFFQKTKQTMQSIAPTLMPGQQGGVSPPSSAGGGSSSWSNLGHVPVDAESIGRLAQDVNTLNAFFSRKTSQQTATEFLEIINEVSLMMFLDLAGLIRHVALRVSEYPSAAQSVYEVAMAVVRMRPEDFDKSTIDILIEHIQPVLDAAPADAREKEATGIAEGRLGLLFMDVLPKDLAAPVHKVTLAHRLKMMSNIPLFGGGGGGHGATKGDEEEEEEGGDRGSGGDDLHSPSHDGTHHHGSAGATTAGGQLLDEVMDMLTQQDAAAAQEAAELDAKQAQAEEERARLRGGFLTNTGYLEKKSPAHNLWQRRFFKLSTRETNNPDRPYMYSLIWYKKEGGSAIKALEVDKIESLGVTQCARSLLYVPPPDTRGLGLASEIGTQAYSVPVLECSCEGGGGGGGGAAGTEFYEFKIVQTDGKEHILRGMKIDRIVKWINMLAQAGQMAYDARSRMWNRAALDKYNEQAAERASHPNVFNVSSSNLPRRTTSTDSAGTGQPPVPPPPAGPSPSIDRDKANALIQQAKAEVQGPPTSPPPPPPPPSSNSADNEAAAAQATKEREERLQREKDLLRKKLQEEERVTASNPIVVQRTTSTSSISGHTATLVMSASSGGGGAVMTNPLHALRAASAAASASTSIDDERGNGPAGSAASSLPPPPPPPPGASPTTSSMASRTPSTRKSPAMRRAQRNQKKKSADAAGANGGGVGESESVVGDGDEDGGEDERPSEVTLETDRESSLPSTVHRPVSYQSAASHISVDMNRETVDLSRRNYHLSESPLSTTPVQTSSVPPSRAHPRDDDGEMEMNSSIVSVDLDGETTNPMAPGKKRVSFSQGPSSGKGQEKKVQQMEVGRKESNSVDKTSAAGPCPCCTIS